ncbi:hypothetical protein D3C81_2008170 [compost metagenome]
MGLETIKAALSDTEERQALAERIKEALNHTTDPWKEIIENKELRKNFEPLQGVEV